MRDRQRWISISTMGKIYGMPASTQKFWRASGRFVVGRDYMQDGRNILYDRIALEKNKALKKYIEEKK